MKNKGLLGGLIAKLGDIYEQDWTVKCLIDIIEEKAKSIHLEIYEPEKNKGTSLVEPEVRGVEFSLTRNDGFTEYHQVKRQQADRSIWTIGDLERSGILTTALERTTNPKSVFVFVSNDKTELDELTRKAKETDDFETYEQLLNEKQKENYKKLAKTHWKRNKTEVLQRLKRIQFQQINHKLIIEKIRDHLRYLSEADSQVTFTVLVTFLHNTFKQDTVPRRIRKINQFDIWSVLKKHQIHPANWANSERVLNLVEDQNNRYLNSIKRICSINHIQKEETQQIIRALVEKPGVYWITGNAGVGKSYTIYEVFQEIGKKDWPILALRLDRIQPQSTDKKVGEELGLPESPPIVLARIAENRPSLLIIDQLDAVSQASGRSTEFFEVFADMINRANSFAENKKMRVVVACREFDIANDNRIKQLKGKDRTFHINLLNTFQIESALKALDILPSSMNEKQKTLFRVPIHLQLLKEIYTTEERKQQTSWSFQTAKDLFDQYWKQKPNQIRERCNRVVNFSYVLKPVINSMSEEQVLSLPEDHPIIERNKEDISVMVSENVMVESGNMFAFFHESFFDYSFARFFVTDKKNILDWLLKEEQHLFKRAQVRQILQYQRQKPYFKSYMDSLRSILSNKKVRFHIKSLIFGWLRQIEDPTQEELEVVLPFLQNHEDDTYRLAWATIRGNSQWFHLLDEEGLIEQWLSLKNQHFYEQVLVMITMPNEATADRIAELIDSILNANQYDPYRMDRAFDEKIIPKSRKLFEVFMRLFQSGIVDIDKEFGYNMFWYRVEALVKIKPDWAVEVLQLYLDKKLDFFNQLERNTDEDLKFESHFYISREVLKTFSEDEYERFVKIIVPWIIQCAEVFLITQDIDGNQLSPPFKDEIWGWARGWRGENKNQSQLLEALVVALRNLSKNNSEEFERIIDKISDSSYEVIHYIIIETYAGCDDKYADNAISYLTKNMNAVENGYENEYSTVKLIEKMSPKCNEENIKELSQKLMNYFPEKKFIKQFHLKRSQNYHPKKDDYFSIRPKFNPKGPMYGNYFGENQYKLLTAVDENRRSPKVRKRMQELRRKFSPERIERPDCRVTTVTSPIPSDKSTKMSDENWINAMLTYNSDEFANKYKKGDLVGGPHELSQVLEKEAEANPKRFLELAEKMPDSVHRYYFTAIIRATSKLKNVPVVEYEKLIFRCHDLPEHSAGRWLFEAVKRHPKLNWSERILKLISWYSLHHSDPEPNEFSVTNGSGSPRIDDSGINTTRGSAAGAICRLLWEEEKYLQYFKDTLKKLSFDENVSVRSSLAECLLPVINYNKDLALKCFKSLVEADILIFMSFFVRRCMHYLFWHDKEYMISLAEKMYDSKSDELKEQGAGFLFFWSFHIDDDELRKKLRDKCLDSKDFNHKKGATNVLLDIFNAPEYRDYAEKILVRLIGDDDIKIKELAADWMHKIEVDDFPNYPELIKATARDSKNRTNYFLKKQLWEARMQPEQLLEVVEIILDNETTEISSDHDISKLVFRVYKNAEGNDEIQSRCLDLVDNLSIVNWHIDTDLTRYEAG